MSFGGGGVPTNIENALSGTVTWRGGGGDRANDDDDDDDSMSGFYSARDKNYRRNLSTEFQSEVKKSETSTRRATSWSDDSDADRDYGRGDRRKHRGNKYGSGWSTSSPRADRHDDVVDDDRDSKRGRSRWSRTAGARSERRSGSSRRGYRGSRSRSRDRLSASGFF